MIAARSPAEEAGAATEEQRQFRAFVQDDATRKVVDQVIGDLAISNASVQKGGIREATRLLGEQRSPRLLVVDLTGIELALSAVNELAEVCEPGVTVIAIGDRNDVGLFRDLINNGVSDYLVKPIAPALLQKSLLNVVESATQGRPSDRFGRLVAVAGARGGVGTTTLATGVAWTIAHRGGGESRSSTWICSSGRWLWRWTWSPRRACGRPSSIPAGSTDCSSTAR